MATTSASEIDSAIWRAIASSSTRIPSVNSDVYYFPQGHFENSSATAAAAVAAENYKINDICPPIFCKVLSTRFFCSQSSDQAFVKFLLLPIHPTQRARHNSSNDDESTQNDVVSFSKILTPSDANNGGGFSVPRFCADSVFPRLNFAADPPVQTLTMRDAHNNAFEFRHIYRGTPRRHLLTTGWSKFVNGKRLAAEDSVVFMQKKSTGQLFIGVRRSLRFGGNSNGFREDQFREAIENAKRGMTFEVVYYPRAGLPDFVLSAEKVEESMKKCWSVGLRVKMQAETEDSSRMTWFQGTIEAVSLPDSGAWAGSPWGMLQVTWDEPEILQITKRVSPWQVEYALPLEEELHSSFHPPSKKLKAPITQPNEEVDDFSFPIPELTHSIPTHNSGMFHYSPFSISMQGARLDPIPAVSNSRTGNLFRSFTEHLRNGPDTEPMPVSTALNLGSSSHCANAAPTYSFQLFGKTIHMSVPGGSENNNALSCGNGERNGAREEINGVSSQANNPSSR